jgi:hypothetical protein
MAFYWNTFTFLYADDIRTSREIYMRTSTVSYGDSFMFLYVDDVRTSQETHLWVSMACHVYSFTIALFM